MIDLGQVQRFDRQRRCSAKREMIRQRNREAEE
jgi:hypothetical protein